MNPYFLVLALALTNLLLAASPAFAADKDEASIQKSMIQRVSDIDALKLAGKVGENNEGLLTQRGALSPEESKLMNEENTDRRALYTILAKRLGLSVKVVGQGRSEELRKRSASRVWLQDPSGKWYQQK